MAAIPKKVLQRFNENVSKYQKILQIAKDRDVNESDTVSIISDILGDLFGYDKYIEVTSEYMIRNTYCDLAIKIDQKVQFLIEVKAIGIDLKDNHLKQAIDYGANLGVQWVILTNGIEWKLYRIRFEQPIDFDLVCRFEFLEMNSKKESDQERLYVISKEGILKNTREDFYEKVKCFNKYTVAALLLSESVVNLVRRELRKYSSGIKIENAEIERVLKNEVIKRELVESDEATAVISKITKAMKKSQRKQKVRAKEFNVQEIQTIENDLKTED